MTRWKFGEVPAFFFKNLRLLFYLDIGLSQGRCCEKNGPFSLFSVSSLYKSLRNVTLSPLVNFGWAWLNPLLFWYRLIYQPATSEESVFVCRLWSGYGFSFHLNERNMSKFGV